MNSTQALAAMGNAVTRYRQATAEYAHRTDLYTKRHAGDTVAADFAARLDGPRVQASADAAWYRDEAAMWAQVASALLAAERLEVL